MATDAKATDHVTEQLRAFSARYGSCAIEAGFVGNLADHECKHGNLPTDAVPSCSCFEPKAGKR